MKRCAAIGLAVLALLATAPQILSQQESRESERKLVNKVAPTYPELARKLSIRGSVKVGVVISAGGSVKSTTVIGGNPVLVSAALDAIRKWKYEPAPSDST